MTVPAVPTPTAPRRDAGIDALRGVAALSVLLFHLWLYALAAPPAVVRTPLDAVWSAGRLGLVLFFVLSGYLLYRPWVASRRSARPSPSVWPYAARRTARVVPAYLLAVGGAILLLHAAGGVPGVRLPPADTFWRFFVFAQNLSPATIMKLDPPLWTLAVEVAFYELLPFAGWWAMRLRRPWLVPAALLCAGLAYDAAIAGRGLSQPWTKALPALLPLFGAGMLLAHLPPGAWRSARARRTVLTVGVTLVVADIVWHQHGAGTAGAVLRDLPAAVGFALIVRVAEAADLKALPARALAAVGTVSFGLYLWHLPVLWALRAHGLLPLRPVLALPVVLGPSLLIATLSWRLLERPAIRAVRAASRGGGPLRPRPAAHGLTVHHRAVAVAERHVGAAGA